MSPPSTPSGISILITSAPQSASWRTQVGPARTRVRSSTLKRASAWLAGWRDISYLVKGNFSGETVMQSPPPWTGPEDLARLDGGLQRQCAPFRRLHPDPAQFP